MSGIVEKLQGLGSAEEFFAELDIDYDPKVVSVSRLHILKRMGQSLASIDETGGDDAAIRESCRAALREAYAEFQTRSPIETRLFKVLKDRDPNAPKKSARAFVPLSDLTP